MMGTLAADGPPFDWLTFVVSSSTGLLTGLLGWWLVARFVRANVDICPGLATYIGTDGDLRSQFRIVNSGRRAYDIQVVVRLAMPGLIASGVRELALVEEFHVPLLEPGETRRWVIRPHRSPGLRDLYARRLSAELRTKLEEGSYFSLRRLFAELPDAEVIVYVISTDALSHYKRVQHRTFTSDSIVIGKFEKRSCTIVSGTAAPAPLPGSSTAI